MNDTERTDDERLSALIDGELPDHEAARLRERIATEPALARRHEALCAANSLASGAYASVADEPLPDGVVKLLRPEAPAAQVVRPRFGASHVWTAAAALAAGLLLALVWIPRPADDDPLTLLAEGRSVASGTALHDVLEGVASGETRTLGGGRVAEPRLSFVDADGDPCRRVDVRGATATLETVACRRAGGWQLDVVAYAPPAPPDGQFGTASDAGSPVDAAIDGEPMDAETERAWIDRDWRKSG